MGNKIKCSEKTWTALFLVLVAVFTVAWIVLYKKIPAIQTSGNFNAWLNTGVLLFTAVVVLVYTHQTAQIRRTAEKQIREVCQANEFDAYTKVHAQLSNERSYRCRGDLFHPYFKKILVRVATEVLGTEYCKGSEEIDTERVIKSLPKNNNQLAKFRELLSDPSKLKPPIIINPPINFLESLETVLLDFDIIAGPLYRQNRAVLEAAKIYETVIERTAPAIGPFVAIQMKLRGDENYKKHYRYLLMHFGLLGELPTVEPPTN